MMNPTTYGYLSDPDQTNGADFQILAAQAPVKTTGDNVDLRAFCTDTNQFDASACAGNATADSVEIVYAANNPGQPVDQLSRMFVYSMARTRDGTLDKDAGTYIRSCFEVLSTLGICREVLWPYDTQKVFVSPSILAQREALGHKIDAYYRIKSTGLDRLDEIISALKSHHPVVFGTLIEQSFTARLGLDRVIDRPKGATIGGHAMVIVGYIDGMFLVKNSWGPYWRDGGYALLSPEYIMWSNTQDLWVPTLGFNEV